MDDITVVVALVAEEEVKVPRPVPEAPEPMPEQTSAAPEAASNGSSGGGGEYSI